MIEDTLRRFAEQDEPPSRLRAADVLVEARRRNRRRTRVGAAAAGAVAVLAALGATALVRSVATTPVTVAGPGCTVERLELPAGVTGGVRTEGIDPSGRYVIGLSGDRNAPRAILWKDRAAVVLPEAFAPTAVNASGLVVGYTGPASKDAGQQRPAAHDGTRVIPLPLPDGAVGGAAYAVNGRGDVLGTVQYADGSRTAVGWRTTGTPAIVSTVDGATGLGLTDDGVAVGSRLPEPRPLRWAAAGGGATTELTVPRGVDSVGAGAAAGEWAAGDASEPKDESTVRWNLRTGRAEVIRGLSEPSVSSTGAVAGLATGAPALWRDGRIATLPLPPGDVHPIGTVSGISADGHVVVGGILSAGGPTDAPAGNPAVDGRTVPVMWSGC